MHVDLVEPAATLEELLVRAHSTPGGALARLLAYDDQTDVRELAMMLLFCAVRDPEIDPWRRRTILLAALPELRRAFTDPAVPRARKLDIEPLLRLCGERLTGGD